RNAHRILSDGIVTPEERRQLQRINAALRKQERDLTQPKGLPGRPWYKHQIWAPGLTTGYAAQPLPALAEALQSGDRKALQRAVDQLQKSLLEATRTAKRATSRKKCQAAGRKVGMPADVVPAVERAQTQL